MRKNEKMEIIDTLKHWRSEALESILKVINKWEINHDKVRNSYFWIPRGNASSRSKTARWNTWEDTLIIGKHTITYASDCQCSGRHYCWTDSLTCSGDAGMTFDDLRWFAKEIQKLIQNRTQKKLFKKERQNMYHYTDYRNGFEKIEIPETPSIEEQITDSHLQTEDFLNRPHFLYEQVKEMDRHLASWRRCVNTIIAHSSSNEKEEQEILRQYRATVKELDTAMALYEQTYWQHIAAKVEVMTAINDCAATAQQKELLRWRYSHDEYFSFDDIATLMGISVPVVENLHTRAFVKVAQHLRKLKETA